MRPQGAGPQGRASNGERVHLARILWHLMKFKEPFNPEVFAQAEEKNETEEVGATANPRPLAQLSTRAQRMKTNDFRV
jgi:hypothetical protein